MMESRMPQSSGMSSSTLRTDAQLPSIVSIEFLSLGIHPGTTFGLLPGENSGWRRQKEPERWLEALVPMRDEKK
jgi:hypothetical protein